MVRVTPGVFLCIIASVCTSIFSKSLIFEFSILFYIRTHLQTFWPRALKRYVRQLKTSSAWSVVTIGGNDR